MNTKKVLLRRIDQLAERLGFDRKKIIAWGFAQAILAAIWSLDSEEDDWRVFLKCAQVLSELR